VSVVASARAGRTRRHPTLWLGILAALSVAGFLAVYVVFLRTGWGLRLDDDAVAGRAGADTASLDAFRRLLGTISTASLALVNVLLVLMALVRRRVALALVVGAVILGANLTTQLLKHVLPQPGTPGAGGEPLTFPSGHATVAMSVVMGLLLVVPPSVRALTAVAGLVYANGIGVAVVAAGWHRPSAAVGAYLVCSAWAAAGAALLVGEGPERFARPVHDRLARASTVLGRLALALVAVAVAVALAATTSALALDQGGVQFGGLERFYAASGAGIAATGVLVVGLLLVPLRDLDLGRPRVRVLSPLAWEP
jgi:hypothetical protein